MQNCLDASQKNITLQFRDRQLELAKYRLVDRFCQKYRELDDKQNALRKNSQSYKQDVRRVLRKGKLGNFRVVWPLICRAEQQQKDECPAVPASSQKRFKTSERDSTPHISSSP